MSLPKKVLIAIGGAVVFGTVLVMLVLFLTSGIAGVADDFLKAMKSGDMNKAAGYLSSEFKRSTAPSKLTEIARKGGFDRFESVSWGQRSTSTSGGATRGELEGEMTTTNGTQIPITLKFVKEDGDWKIFSLNAGRAGANQPTGNLLITKPDNAAMVKMVGETMRVFAESVNAQSMQKLYDHTAQVWQSQTSPDALEKIFKGFIDAKINMLALQNLAPVFANTPEVADNGVLEIKGYYPSRPLQVSFEHKYLLEGTEWKLIAINVNARPVQENQQQQ